MTLAWLTIVSGTTDQNVFQASSIAIGEPQRTDTHHEAGLHQMGNPRYSRPDKKKGGPVRQGFKGAPMASFENIVLQ